MGHAEVEWEQAKSEFEWDGTLRDLYILDADVDIWQRIVDCLRSSEYPWCYRVRSDEEESLPSDVREMFKSWDVGSPLLSVAVDGITLNCHFFTVDKGNPAGGAGAEWFPP